MKPAKAALLVFLTSVIALTTIRSEAANDPQAIQKSVNSKFACADIQKATSKIGVFAKNIANKDTTRTPEGGAYKRVDVSCRELFCEMTAKSDFKLMYDPTHPDANSAGYVQVPRIDVPSEFASLTSAAAEIRLLAENGTCGATAIASPTMAMVKYGAASVVQGDTFTYATDGHLASWTRLEKDGSSKSYAFTSDGNIVSK